VFGGGDGSLTTAASRLGHRDTALYASPGPTLGQVLAGPRRSRADSRLLSTDRLRVATDPPLPLDLDGEVRATTPVHTTLLPQALRVMVPPSFVDT
jgi:diacylglycerol kinase family enzyme